MFDIITKNEYFDWIDPKVAKSSRYSLVPSHYSLKGIQDAWILSLLENKDNLKIAEVGGGTSRVLELLSHGNECWNIDKFEGLGAGPVEIPELPGVKIVRSYMGDFDPEIPDNYFDIVFSISVIEHVPKERLIDCFADCYRILKPGGLLLHAIDLYISDKPTALTAVVDGYWQATEKQGFKWLSPPAIDSNSTFKCHYASNSDLTMSQWNRIAPTLRDIRKTHQSVSIKLAAIKEGNDALTQNLLTSEFMLPEGKNKPQLDSSDELVQHNESSLEESKITAKVPSQNDTHGATTEEKTVSQEADQNFKRKNSDGLEKVSGVKSAQTVQDNNWLTARDFVRQHLRQNEKIITPVRFKSSFSKADGYPKTSKISPEQYQWVIVHKGNLQAIDTSFIKRIIQEFRPVFSNAVFVVFSSRADLPNIGLDSVHVLPLVESLYPNRNHRPIGVKVKRKMLGVIGRLNSQIADTSTGDGQNSDPIPVRDIQASQNLGLQSLSQADLIKQSESMRWFHAINFGSFQSAGRFQKGQRQNITLFPVFELLKGVHVRGMDCLDVGAACGLISFGLRTLGARRIAAVDIVEFKTFRFANELLNANVEYYPGTRADSVSDTFLGQQFDLVVCAGVLYHMFNPMGAIAEARLLLRKKGLFVVETAYDPKRKDASMEFNSESDNPFKEAYTYWNISELAIVGMLKLCGFNILRCVRLKSPSRIAFLAQAVDYDDIDNRTPLLKRMHELGFGEQKYLSRKYPQDQSRIEFDVSLPDRIIDIETYVAEFPHHVDFPKAGFGESLYNPKQGNF
ncbi:MAG: hypothetical protein Kow00121_22290 [Elainellaceae cyanobacterium]